MLKKLMFNVRNGMLLVLGVFKFSSEYLKSINNILSPYFLV